MAWEDGGLGELLLPCWSRPCMGRRVRGAFFKTVTDLTGETVAALYGAAYTVTAGTCQHGLNWGH